MLDVLAQAYEVDVDDIQAQLETGQIVLSIAGEKHGMEEQAHHRTSLLRLAPDSSQLLDHWFQSVSSVPAEQGASHSAAISIARNMELGIEALGAALADSETPVSHQLARSMAATEKAWRDLEAEFGLLSSVEVSELVGSKSPNRSFASEQRGKGRLIAVKRPGGFRYPGFQFDRTEHMIRPVMAELIRVAEVAGRSEASLALWMALSTGYLDGRRPVDTLSQPEKVVEAAEQSFNVQW